MAFSGSSDQSDFGDITNPHNGNYLVGGSSSVSEAAPAAGECDIAIGTDQGGSIRIPAAWCGLVGLKPTLGLVPYTGIFAIDMSLDHVGPQTVTVSDCAKTLQAIAGLDVEEGIQLDPRQPKDLAVGDYSGELDRGIEEVRIGVLKEGLDWDASDPHVTAGVRAGLARMVEAGAEVVNISIPSHRTSVGVEAAVIIAGGMDQMIALEGVGTNYDGWYDVGLVRFLNSALRERGTFLRPNLRSCWLAAMHLRRQVGQLYYARAQNLALDLRRAYDRALRQVDIIAMPTTAQSPFRHEPTHTPMQRATRSFANALNTSAANLTGHPALTVPAAMTSDSLPIGLMLVGRRFQEGRLLQAAYALEQLDDWRNRRP